MKNPLQNEQYDNFALESKEYLNMLKRQTTIHNMYHIDKPLVMK